MKVEKLKVFKSSDLQKEVEKKITKYIHSIVKQISSRLKEQAAVVIRDKGASFDISHYTVDMDVYDAYHIISYIKLIESQKKQILNGVKDIFEQNGWVVTWPDNLNRIEFRIKNEEK